MANIKDVKVWKNASKTETRIYVHTTDEREGVIYRTGNAWHAKNSVEGNLTDDEWNAAKELAYYDNAWHTIYNDAKKTFTNGSFKSNRCPDCGGNCGANCTSNRW
jgi:hypothetical protein